MFGFASNRFTVKWNKNDIPKMIQTKQDAYAFLASNDSAVEGLLLLSPCVNIASKQEQS